MNKKLNTLYFLIGATVLNLLLLASLAIMLALAFSLAYRSVEEVSMAMSWLAVIVILFGSIAGTFFLYSRIIKWVVAKWNMEAYIDPIFKPRRR